MVEKGHKNPEAPNLFPTSLHHLWRWQLHLYQDVFMRDDHHVNTYEDQNKNPLTFGLSDQTVDMRVEVSRYHLSRWVLKVRDTQLRAFS